MLKKVNEKKPKKHQELSLSSRVNLLRLRSDMMWLKLRYVLDISMHLLLHRWQVVSSKQFWVQNRDLLKLSAAVHDVNKLSVTSSLEQRWADIATAPSCTPSPLSDGEEAWSPRRLNMVPGCVITECMRGMRGHLDLRSQVLALHFTASSIIDIGKPIRTICSPQRSARAAEHQWIINEAISWNG